MASNGKNLVQLTRVRFYHRTDMSYPAKWKTPPAAVFTLKATLAETNYNRHEIQVLHEPEMDPTSPRNGSGTNPGFPRNGSESKLLVAFDLKKIKSCLINAKVWIEITDASGLRHALEFTEDDPNFLAFDQKLMTLVKLLGVKCKITDSVINRSKWVEIASSSTQAVRPLPVIPPHDDAAGESEDYEYTATIWPTLPPPPTPSSNLPHRMGRQGPRRGSSRSSVDSGDTCSISNSTNTMLSSSSDGTLDLNTTTENEYLMPTDTPWTYMNNDPSPTTSKPKPGSQRQVSSHVTSGWSCSACTFQNPSTLSRCKVCDRPRKASDCAECQRLDQDVPPGCKECRKESGTKPKTSNCQECLRVGNRVPPECKECRNVTDNKSLDCNECIRSGRSTLEKHREHRNTANKAARTSSVPKPSPSSAAFPTTSTPSGSSSSIRGTDANVDRWRCKKCTFLNPANVFFCKQCFTARDDGWRCHVCETVISLDVVHCQRCNVWRCRLCTNQNDAGQNRSNFCQACSQPR